MIIIGLTGTIGAGKGAVVEYLQTKGFTHFSARSLLLKEIEKRCMPPTRDSMFLIANEWRKEKSPDYIAVELFKEAKASGGNCVIESLRSLGEIESLQKEGEFYLFGIDADPKLRYERVVLRKQSTDNVSYEKFIEDERKETETTEPWQQNLKACIQRADYVIRNNGSIEDLHRDIDRILKEIGL